MTEFLSLSGKVAVVTGGYQGIGLATVQRLSAAGASVVIGDLKDCSMIAEQIGGRYQETDVSKEESMHELMQFASDAFGGLDIIVNNAGVYAAYRSIAESPKEDFDFCYRINTMGAVNGIKAATSFMKTGGSIVSVASLAATRGVADLGSYAASKWAVAGVTQTAALELGPKGIRVNCVCPSSVKTPMAMEEGGEALLAMEELTVPLGRIAEPEEIASVIHFLASDEASFVSGQVIKVCGGMSAGTSVAAHEKLAS